MFRKFLALGVWAAVGAASSAGTSIILDVEPNYIIIVADSRQEVVNLKGIAEVRDDKCKIVVLGQQFAFAETGREGYTPDGLRDRVPEFHGTLEAVSAFNAVPNHGLLDVAQQWATQLRELLGRFYSADPSRVQRLGIGPQNDLLIGIFAGVDRDGALKIYLVRLAIADPNAIEHGEKPIAFAIYPFPHSENPVTLYSTNPVTNELLDGKTERGAATSKLWQSKARKIRPHDEEVQRLEFLVDRTADYDPEVHSPINALKVTRQGVTWIDNHTCR
jgi:hypothetical protein